REGPVPTGSLPFPRPLTFPAGTVCRTFDELVAACHEEWAEALELLRKGYLEIFLGGLGRADLAQAARQAAQYPDPDRGLDQLLARFPSEALKPAEIDAEPRQINLGQMRIGEDRALTVRLFNRGNRLLYGT